MLDLVQYKYWQFIDPMRGNFFGLTSLKQHMKTNKWKKKIVLNNKKAIYIIHKQAQ